MSQLRESLIIKEINAIISSGEKPVHFTWQAELFADNEKVNILKILFINISGDYASDWQDMITAGFKVMPSVFMRKIYPNRMKLTIHLTKIPLGENTSGFGSEEQFTQKFKCYLTKVMNLTEHQDIDMVDDRYLDMSGPMDMEVQMADPFADAVRLHQLGMNLRKVTPGDALATAVIEAMKRNVKHYSGPTISFDMIEPDNKRPREVISLYDGTKVEDLPHYIQDKEGGIYNAGIRMFYQRGCFYVWPKYYLGGKSEDRRTLTIFNIPSNQFPNIERTYRETEFQLIVVSTGTSSQTDNSDEIDLNLGNGIRFTDAFAILEGMINVKNNKAIARRGISSTEFLDSDSGRGLNFAPVLGNRITANAFAAVSRIAKRKGILEQFEWENASPYLAFPGMEVTVISYRNGTYYEKKGSLQGAEYHMSPPSNNMKSNRLAIKAVLSVYVSRDVKEIE